jgi:UDP-N-acetylmuramyl pentapeptide synthase
MIRYSLSDMLRMLRTPLGRIQLREGMFQFLFPVFRILATHYRRLFVSDCRITAVVGSFGKTTTTRAIAVALNIPIGQITERNSLSHVARSVLRISHDSSRAVIEVGIEKKGEMQNYTRLVRPDVVVVTSIGSEHNRSFGDLLGTRHEKANMVRALSADGWAVLNGDDPNVVWMKSQCSGNSLFYGYAPSNDVRILEHHIDWPRGMRVRLSLKGKDYSIRTRLWGAHMAYPIAAAVATASIYNMNILHAIDRLATLEPTAERLALEKLENDIYLLRDAFKSSPETIHRALDLVKKIPAKRKMIVLGEISEPPGSQGPIYRKVGERLAELFDYAVIIGGNFQRYRTGAVHAGMKKEQLYHAGHSIKLAVRAIQAKLEPGDVVLIKGRYGQRIDRVALGLMGRPIRCNRQYCDVRALYCETCPILERG